MRRAKPYAPPQDDDAPLACDVLVRLSGMAEEMPLVVMVITAVRADEEEAVTRLAVVVQCSCAAGDGGIKTAGLLLHPGDNHGRLSPGRLRCAFGHEARGEGLGEDIQVSPGMAVQE